MTAPASRLPKMPLPTRSVAPRAGVDLFAPAEPVPPVVAGEIPARVRVSELVLDPRIQPRETMDPARGRELLADLLREAAVEGKDTALVYKDPLVVYVDPKDGTKRVAEGFNRTTGARLSEVTPELLAFLRSGGVEEARLWAAGSNADHGQPRTAADRRRVMLWYLDDAKGQVTLTAEVLQRLPEPVRARVSPGQTITCSDGVIGYLCQVSQSTVSRLRGDLKRERAGAATHAAHELEQEGGAAEVRVGLDGKGRRTPQPRITRLFKESLLPGEELDDLAAKRRNEDAGLGGTRRGAASRTEPQRSGPDGPTRDPSKLFDWRAKGARWMRQNRKHRGVSDDKLRRQLAAAFLEQLAAAAWGAQATGGQAQRARDLALHALFEGARRAR